MSKIEKQLEKENKKKGKYEAFGDMNKNKVMTIVCYVFIVAIIVLASCFQMFFDIEHFNLTKFLTNLCLSLAISILTMIISIKDGELSNEGKKRGDYYELKVKFSQALTKIVDRDVFRQFCDILFNREKQSYVNGILNGVNIINTEYMQVSAKDLETLRKEPKICVIGHDDKGNEITKPLDVISEVQYLTLKKYREGKFKYPKLEYTFFTSRNDSNGYKYQASLQQKQNNVKIMSILYRCILITILSIVFALAAVNPTGANVFQILLDTISRLMTLASSMLFGYMIAHDEMKQNMDAMQYKIDIIEQFIVEKETGAFKPINTEELVLQKIKEKEQERKRIEQEQERLRQEALANVVTPDIVKKDKNVIEIEMTQEEYDKRFNN